MHAAHELWLSTRSHYTSRSSLAWSLVLGTPTHRVEGRWKVSWATAPCTPSLACPAGMLLSRRSVRMLHPPVGSSVGPLPACAAGVPCLGSGSKPATASDAWTTLRPAGKQQRCGSSAQRQKRLARRSAASDAAMPSIEVRCFAPLSIFACQVRAAQAEKHSMGGCSNGGGGGSGNGGGGELHGDADGAGNGLTSCRAPKLRQSGPIGGPRAPNGQSHAAVLGGSRSKIDRTKNTNKALSFVGSAHKGSGRCRRLVQQRSGRLELVNSCIGRSRLLGLPAMEVDGQEAPGPPQEAEGFDIEVCRGADAGPGNDQRSVRARCAARLLAAAAPPVAAAAACLSWARPCPPVCFPPPQAYAANYSGHARIDRLMFAAEKSVGKPLELEALKLAADVLKKVSASCG